MFKEYLIMLILAASPFSESRGAVLYGLGAGLNPFIVLFLSVLSNCLIVPFLFFIFDRKLRNIVLRPFKRIIRKKILKNIQKFEKYEEFALLLFVAVPLPFTGAWTGTIMASLLGLKRRKSILIIWIGIIIAAVLVWSGVGSVLFLLK